MKTAEDVAEEIHAYANDTCVTKDTRLEAIAQALTAYAEERYREGMDKGARNAEESWKSIADERVKEAYHCCQEPRVAHNLARAEALEEAMSEAYYRCEDKGGNQENCLCAPCHIWRNIRALKAKP